MKKIAILGCGGHAKVVAEIAEFNLYDITFFDDEWPKLSNFEHWCVSGDTKLLLTIAKDFDLVVVAIGHNNTRYTKQLELTSAGAKFGILAHPKSVISKYARIKEGSVIMANAVVQPFSVIGECSIINTSAIIEHDCNLAHGVHVSPNSSIAGGVQIGKNSWIGIGSQVKQLVRVGNNTIIGAGSTVLSDIPSDVTAFGSPAKVVK
jgi:sugar O-acyltransferase (sialic acid O-acetyltransferase NeuD family)